LLITVGIAAGGIFITVCQVLQLGFIRRAWTTVDSST
jgi:hypothetical protein